MQFTNLLIIMAVAFVAPLVVAALPTALRLPSVVLEIVAGIVLGPSVLGWIQVDAPVQVLALIGLAFLLFLAGLEIDVHKLRGRPLTLALAGFVVSFALAVGTTLGVDPVGRSRLHPDRGGELPAGAAQRGARHPQRRRHAAEPPGACRRRIVP